MNFKSVLRVLMVLSMVVLATSQIILKDRDFPGQRHLGTRNYGGHSYGKRGYSSLRFSRLFNSQEIRDLAERQRS